MTFFAKYLPITESILFTRLFIFKAPLKYWVSGHTHLSVKQKIGDGYAISNCMGYPKQKTIYNEKAYIDFE